MSYRDDNGGIVFEAPTSTMEFGSLERNTGDIDLLWPYQGGAVPDPLAMRFREKDRLEFFCPREILFHGLGEDKATRAASQDDIFGVRFVWPYEARKGERYVFTFVGSPAPQPTYQGAVPDNIEMPDFILVNGVRLHRREIDTDLYVTEEYVAPEDGPMTVTFIKDRFYCMEHYEESAKGWTPMVAPTCRVYLHLQLGISIACEHFGPTDRPQTTGEPFKLPEGLRTFYAPGAFQFVPDQDLLPCDYPPVVKPDYSTAEVYYNQFHDLYLDDEKFLGERKQLGMSTDPEGVKEFIRISLDNGINCFTARAEVLDALESMGLRDAPLTIEYSGKYIKRVHATEDTDEGGNPVFRLGGLISKTIPRREGEKFELSADEARAERKEEGTRIANVLRRFPNALVVYRLNEFDGCQYLFVNVTEEDRARVGRRAWYDLAKIADIINHEAMDELFAEAREVDASRFKVGSNVCSSSYLMSHAIHSGAEFTINKTIGRNQVNVVIATSRGVNMSFDGWIGLQHDAWGALRYNHDSGTEIESVHRSFFFNGAKFHDAEFQGLALTRDGQRTFNLKGLAWIKVTRLAAIHPRRGTQRAQIAFMRGSDNIWGWGVPGIPHGYDECDPTDPKEHVDFDLLNVVFPKYGDWRSFNPVRWMTGTPYGPCDIISWDAPLDALKRYHALVMLGANRVEEEDWQHYLDYVRSGGTLVMGLYQLFPPTRDRVYVKQDVSDLLGIKLGGDEPIWELPTAVEREAFISQHYNRVELAGAEVVETLPNGDPLLTRYKLGEGYAYFFTTDRLTTIDGVAEKLIRSLFDPHVPVRLEPEHDWMETAISEKGDLRIIALMDHGRDCLPTDAGGDTGPYTGTATLDLDNLGLPDGEYEVLQVVMDDKITKLEAIPISHSQKGRIVEVLLDGMGSCAELVLGPKGKAEHTFFWG